MKPIRIAIVSATFIELERGQKDSPTLGQQIGRPVAERVRTNPEQIMKKIVIKL